MAQNEETLAGAMSCRGMTLKGLKHSDDLIQFVFLKKSLSGFCGDNESEGAREGVGRST